MDDGYILSKPNIEEGVQTLVLVLYDEFEEGSMEFGMEASLQVVVSTGLGPWSGGL